MFNAGIETMKQGGYITEYDQVIAKKLAYIMWRRFNSRNLC